MTRIEGTVRQNAVGGAGFDAARTTTAVIGCKRRVGFEWQVERDFRQQEIRAMFGMDETCVLANPANACALGKIAFQDGAGIGIPAVRNRTSDLLLDELDEFLQSHGEDVVVICVSGIGGGSSPHT